jgi:CubicO group peptidase (beta-lactamase class C family)
MQAQGALDARHPDGGSEQGLDDGSGGSHGLPGPAGLDGVVHGTVERGFEPVRAVFAENFRRRGELGAAVAVYQHGRKVVDLWGGVRDAESGEPWQQDTLVMVFSTTKGMAAMALAVAHSQGLLDFDERVARYWPEFGQAGKSEVTVRQLLAHQAGLSAIDTPLDVALLADHDALAHVLAAQPPAWSPGERCGYHAISIGFYEGELIRRVDPEGRTLGQFFRDEVAGPLGLEFYIGLPAGIPDSRLASIAGIKPRQLLRSVHKMPFRFAIEMAFKKKSLTARTFYNPRGEEMMGDRRFREVEIPAATGMGEARAIARAYGVLAMGGAELGITPDTFEALTAPATPPSGRPRDLVLHYDAAYSLGFSKAGSDFAFGSGTRAFGTPGAGGSFGFADPEVGIGFAYTMNRMGVQLYDDPREKALRDAVYGCLRSIS